MAGGHKRSTRSSYAPFSFTAKIGARFNHLLARAQLCKSDRTHRSISSTGKKKMELLAWMRRDSLRNVLTSCSKSWRLMMITAKNRLKNCQNTLPRKKKESFNTKSAKRDSKSRRCKRSIQFKSSRKKFKFLLKLKKLCQKLRKTRWLSNSQLCHRCWKQWMCATRASMNSK